MYKISYEKCVCFIFLVILAFLSCSGFHIDKMIPVPDHNKKYLFTSFSFNESAYVSDINSQQQQQQQQEQYHQQMMEQHRRFFHRERGGDSRDVRGDQQLVGALPLQELQRAYERRRKRRIRMTRIRAQENRAHKTTNDLTPISNDRNQYPHIDNIDLARSKRAHNNTRNKNRFCPGQDVATRALRAITVLEGRIRSKSKTVSSKGKYNVTYEVKDVLKDESGFRQLKNDSIRLQFANERRKRGTCDVKEVNGVVAAQFNISKNYILFANRIGIHNYEILGPPVEATRKNLKEIRDILCIGKKNCVGVTAGAITRKLLRQVKVVQGRKLRLRCDITGNPPPVARWFKDGHEIRPGRNTKIRFEQKRNKTVLRIKKVRYEDAGRYTCSIVDLMGHVVNSTGEVRVEAGPRSGQGPEGSTPCAAAPQESYCLNGGTCLYFKTLAEYACQCADGFNGNRCEQKEVINKSSMLLNQTKIDCKLGLRSSYYC